MEEYSIKDLGYDAYLDRSGTNTEDAMSPADFISSQNIFDTTNSSVGSYNGGLADLTETATDPGTIVSGSLTATLNQNGTLFYGKTSFNDTTNGYRMGLDQNDNSYKFIMGTTGQQIDWNVTTADTLTIVGGFSVTTIDIGGSDATSMHVDADGNLWLGDATYAAAPFKVSNVGAVTSISGTIGGWSIGSDYIRDVANSCGLASTVTDGDDVRFWAGDTFASRSTADLRIYESGAIVCTNITATGTINATGGYIGTTTALVFESQGINTGVTGYIRGGQTDYNMGVGYFLGYSGGNYKFSIGDGGVSRYLTWDGNKLTVKGVNNATYYSFTAGENIDANHAVYLKASDGKVYHTNGLTGGEATENFLGIAVETKTTGQDVLIQTDGLYEGIASVSNVYIFSSFNIDSDTNNLDSWQSFAGLTSADAFGCTFTTGADNSYIPIIGLSFKYAGNDQNNAYPYVIRIYATSGGLPTGGALVNIGYLTASFCRTTVGDMLYFKIPNFNASPNTMYAVVMEAVSGTHPDITLSMGYAAVVSGGNGIKYASGAWTAEPTKNYDIVVYKGSCGVAGEPAYLSNTAGHISSTAGTYSKKIGTFLSNTSLLLNTNFKKKTLVSLNKKFAENNASDSGGILPMKCNKVLTISETGLTILKQINAVINTGYTNTHFNYYVVKIGSGIEVIWDVASSPFPSGKQLNLNQWGITENATIYVYLYWGHVTGGGSTPTQSTFNAYGDVLGSIDILSLAQ